MDSELVMAAKNSRKKKRNPNNDPNGIWLNTFGSVTNPIPKVPGGFCTTAGPRNTNAAGIAIMPPSTTSQNSLPAAAVSPLSATSSFGLR